ncbi:MAG: hypothetical protein IJ511_00380 [Bacteroides sp.]|nr:hypothetical protein [Bacteroides sp.]
MADNYLEKQYELYQARKAAWEKSKRLGKNVKKEKDTSYQLTLESAETEQPDKHSPYHEVETTEELHELLREHLHIRRCAFQNIDFTQLKGLEKGHRYSDCLFMGCTFTAEMRGGIDKSCLLFSRIDVPFNAFRNNLYTAETLYKGYRRGEPESYADCYDNDVYQHYLKMGKSCTDIKETLARTLHDHSISDAMHNFLARYDERKVVGIMGGHGLLRTEESYRKVVLISKRLTESGCLMVSGGGPGAMEATHLGAWMAGRTEEEVMEALQLLEAAPSYKDKEWLESAFLVRDRYPQMRYASLGVPTWLYGHEPATPFATHIAKYFENAIREDGILTIAMGGIIYTPGSAGTMQEIFQDAVQNHYLSFGYASPMAFLGVEYWTKEIPVYPLLEQLMERGKYKNLMLSLSDSVEEVTERILAFRE